MNSDTATLTIQAVTREALPQKLADILLADEKFVDEHIDGLIHVASVANPDARSNPDAEAEAAQNYAEGVLRGDIEARYPKDYIPLDD
jgi:hypothetical protein